MGKEAGASESVDDHARLEISELLRAGMSMFKLLQPGGAGGQRQFGLHVTVNAACKSGAPMTCASGRAAFAPRSVFVPRSGHRAEIFIWSGWLVKCTNRASIAKGEVDSSASSTRPGVLRCFRLHVEINSHLVSDQKAHNT